MVRFLCATVSVTRLLASSVSATDDTNCADESTLLQRTRLQTLVHSSSKQEPETLYHYGLIASDFCSTESVSQDLCQQAVQALTGATYSMDTGSYSDKPPGCSWHESGYDSYYNTNPAGRNNGEYTPVCTESKALPLVAHLGVSESDYCSTDGVDIERCLEAGHDLLPEGAVQGNPTLNRVSSGAVAPGCSLRTDGNGWRILYNSNANAANDGRFTPICTEGAIVPVAAHLGVSSSDYCSTESVSIESCLQAGRDLLPEGAVQEYPTLLRGSWDHVPPGCSMNHDNGAWRILYNSKANGANNGVYTPICTEGAIVPVAAHLGVSSSDYCSTERVSIESCLQAGRDLLPEGAVQSNPTLARGSWDHVPTGCSMNHDNGAWRILYNSKANGANNGVYTPICTEDAIVPVAAHLDTEALDHCSSASVGIESCLQAVRDLMPNGADQAETTLQSGSYANKPPGCSMETETSTAYYNTDNGGHNNGDFTLVCADAASLREELDGLEEEVQQQGQDLQLQIDNLQAQLDAMQQSEPTDPSGGEPKPSPSP